MRDLREFRAGKPAYYPDQTVYAAYACAELGLVFDDISDGAGLAFRVGSKTGAAYFGAGRCSWYPQNNSTAATLASDKYFANRILGDAGVATLGGEYFFLNTRHRMHRPPGHEREDAFEYLKRLDSSAFIKPLSGYSALIEPIKSGLEYRIFLLDGETVYSARKFPPGLTGDGARSVRDLLDAHNAALKARVYRRSIRRRSPKLPSMSFCPRANAGKSRAG